MMMVSCQSAFAHPTIQERQRSLIASHHPALLARRAAASLVAVRALARPSPMPTPRECGAKGDGADDSGPLQEWADLAGPLHLDGRYSHPQGPIYWSSGTTVFGHGIGTLYGPNSGDIRHTHRHYTFPGNERRTDNNIAFHGVTFESEPKAIGAVDNLVFIGVQNLTFVDCVITRSRMYGLTLSNCRGVNIARTQWLDIGDNRKFTGPAGSWWAGCALFMLTPNFDVWIDNPLFRDCYGIGMWADGGGRNLTVRGFVLDGAAEAGIVGLPPGSMIEVTSLRGIRHMDLSGHGMELQESDFSIRLGQIEDCDGAGIYLTDGRNVDISGGSIDRCNQMYAPSTGAIIMLHNGLTRNVTIANVGLRASDDKGAHALTFWNNNPSTLMQSVLPVGNNAGDPAQWKSGPLGFYPPDKPAPAKSLVWAPTCRAAGNVGFADR